MDARAYLELLSCEINGVNGKLVIIVFLNIFYLEKYINNLFFLIF